MILLVFVLFVVGWMAGTHDSVSKQGEVTPTVEVRSASNLETEVSKPASGIPTELCTDERDLTISFSDRATLMEKAVCP